MDVAWTLLSSCTERELVAPASRRRFYASMELQESSGTLAPPNPAFRGKARDRRSNYSDRDEKCGLDQ